MKRIYIVFYDDETEYHPLKYAFVSKDEALKYCRNKGPDKPGFYNPYYIREVSLIDDDN